MLTFDLTPRGMVRGTFKDGDLAHWAIWYIATLEDRNIALGDKNGNFRPKEDLTPAYFAVLEYRALGL
ncbi:S-layer homology domain-containing protein [Lysinibacillus xylanilyticus]|uniref:S-layer homology domain-containing protein n=1 Tax=Lysinibacillus xylanilyticus TaxID=582475 RepID=UPI00380A8FEB